MAPLLKILLLIISITSLRPLVAGAQIKNVFFSVEAIGGDSLQVATLRTIPIFPKSRRGRVDARRYERLVRAVKLTYPIAVEANKRLRDIEATIEKMPKRAQAAYIKEAEKQIKREYMPLVKQMSMYQGMILIKLIDRQTGQTSFALVQELRGKFSAFFWQGIAKMFGGDLKAEYDKQGQDKLIEELIELYEAGLL